MSPIGQILRARWPIVAGALICCLLGGLLATTISPARYQARARVTLNFIKPDPVTGVFMDFKRMNPYFRSQVSLIEDIQVIGPAMEASGWLRDPDLVAIYNARDAADDRDLATWAAERAQRGVRATIIPDSNLLEISFLSTSPLTAKAVVAALRDSYVDALIRDRRSAAQAQAQGLQALADKVRVEILKLQAEKSAYEQATGVVLREDYMDLDTVQMKALAPSVQTPRFRYVDAGASKAEANLARMDAQIANAAAVLGPSHPQLAALKSNRVLAEAELVRAAQFNSRRADMASAQEAVRSQGFDSQKLKVVDRRDEALRLRLLQDRIVAQRAQFNSAMAAAGRMREMMSIVESGVSPVGEAEVLPQLAFPNLPLIYGGAGALGLIGGVLLALLTELFNLRIRTVAGMGAVVRAPLLGVVPNFRACAVRPLRRRKFKAAPGPELQAVGAS